MKGRPTKYTDEIADIICMKLSDGITLSEICREDGMPHRTTVYDWKDANETFSLRIARARDIGEDAIADDAIDIADDGTNDWMKRQGKDGEEYWVLNGEHVQRSKLRIDTRLKLLAKWNPKKYGERVDHTNAGGAFESTPDIKVFNCGPEMASTETDIDTKRDV